MTSRNILDGQLLKIQVQTEVQLQIYIVHDNLSQVDDDKIVKVVVIRIFIVKGIEKVIIEIEISDIEMSEINQRYRNIMVRTYKDIQDIALLEMKRKTIIKMLLKLKV